MTERPLADILKGCRRGREAARQAFYERFYSYALSVCLAYASDREDAREMLNDGFLKAFRHMDELKNEAVVAPWLRRIMVNTAIDYYRRNRKRVLEVSTDLVDYSLEEPYLNEEAIFFAAFGRTHSNCIASITNSIPYGLQFIRS